jgi:hypothetical protein
MKCKIKNCKEKYFCKSFCKKHYNQRPEVKAYQKAYQKTDKFKAYRKAYQKNRRAMEELNALDMLHHKICELHQTNSEAK